MPRAEKEHLVAHYLTQNLIIPELTRSQHRHRVSSSRPKVTSRQVDNDLPTTRLTTSTCDLHQRIVRKRLSSRPHIRSATWHRRSRVTSHDCHTLPLNQNIQTRFLFAQVCTHVLEVIFHQSVEYRVTRVPRIVSEEVT